MTFDIVTIFPAMIEAPLAAGVLGRAIAAGLLDVKVHDLRDFTSDRHRVVDDVPYGGGPGMVLKADPVFRALDRIEVDRGTPLTVILTSPQGRQFTQAEAERLSGHERLVFLCGRYEGFDERVRTRISEELSIGDYVLTGGELPALVMIDAIARLKPGVVGDEQSVADDSFSRGLLDFPHYTRPAELRWRGDEDDDCSAKAFADPSTMLRVGPEHGRGTERAERILRVPEVLLSGHHAEIRRWRKREALARTLARRPELLETAALDDEERRILAELHELQDGRIAGLQEAEAGSDGNDQRSKK